jgi:hypothetical protein
MTCFTFLFFTVYTSVHCSVCFVLGLLPVNMLYFGKRFLPEVCQCLKTLASNEPLEKQCHVK